MADEYDMSPGMPKIVFSYARLDRADGSAKSVDHQALGLLDDASPSKHIETSGAHDGAEVSLRGVSLHVPHLS